MAGQWRDWAEFQFVTDPEQFLHNSTYLMNTISERRGRSRAAPVNRWRMVVLEDAGEFLVPDAKHLQGQALSRLLNVCDGALGQATKALVVVTTNEPQRSLHKALSRPGRCLAEVHFARFGTAAATEWLARRGVARPTTGGPHTLAELFAITEGRSQPSDRPRPVGFAEN